MHNRFTKLAFEVDSSIIWTGVVMQVKVLTFQVLLGTMIILVLLAIDGIVQRTQSTADGCERERLPFGFVDPTPYRRARQRATLYFSY